MALVVKSTGGGDFEKPQLDEFLPGALATVVDLGMQDSVWKGKISKKHKVALVWEVGHKMSQGPDAGKNYLISKKYTLSLAPQSQLYKDLVGWIGTKNMNPDVAAKGFDIEKLIGIPSKLMLSETEPNEEGRQYINILKMKLAEKGSFVLTRKGAVPKWLTETLESDAMSAALPDAATDLADLGDVADLI